MDFKEIPMCITALVQAMEDVKTKGRIDFLNLDFEQLLQIYTALDFYYAYNNNELNRMKYTILRRAICTRCHQGHQENQEWDRPALERLCSLIEGKSLDELKEIHKNWIGY